jgi:hypothetical protein
MRKYWKKIKAISRDRGISCKEARRAAVEGVYKVVIRIEDYLGKKSAVDINGTFYLEADSPEDAKAQAYGRVLNWFDRDEGFFIKRKHFKVEAFGGHKKQKGLIKWRHAKGKWQIKEL